MKSFPQNSKQQVKPSEWPKKREFKGIQVSFYKINNERLAEVFEEMIASSANNVIPYVDKSKFESEEKYQETLASLEIAAIIKSMASEKMREARNLFFKHMSIEGIGFVNENIEDILEEDLAYSMQLFQLGVDVFLGKHLKNPSDKESSK